MTKNLVAVVPIREGSQRVKNKNFRPFCGKNLIIYKIEALKKIYDYGSNKDELVYEPKEPKNITKVCYDFVIGKPFIKYWPLVD